MTAADREVFDIVGIGFGPSNLALAIAVDERNRAGGPPLTATFLERQATFGWHRGMLLDDATMQVSFLKDLVTMRNPVSDFSFLSYLRERDRLIEFINHKVLFPLRIEFHDYLDWVADRLASFVTYSRRVVGVEPVIEGDTLVAFDVVSEDPDGVRTTCRGRNVVVAVGLSPSLPPGAALGPRIWHNLDLLSRVASFPRDPEPQRFVVVGAGQSAAECVAYLHQEFASAEVCSVYARYGYAPADDSPFANRIFDPDAVDLYYGADDAVKRMLFDYHRNTNYSVVDGELIDELYRREYQERVKGNRRLRMMNASQVIEVDDSGDTLKVSVRAMATGEVDILDTDVLVYATGYRPGDAVSLLGDAGDLVERLPDGAPAVNRDYRLQLRVPSQAGVYVQGGTEHSHGISSSLLSNVAVRTGEIAASVASRRDAALGVPAGVGPGPDAEAGRRVSTGFLAG